MEDLISIIVPVYNVEKYLDRCLESIVNQTYKNLEIVLVDDGSIDNSGEKCDEWLKKDNRIKVIHKQNGGVSSARNVGLEEASGKYITFIDSDDYVLENYIENLCTLIDNHTKVVRIILDSNFEELKVYSQRFFDIFENTGKFNTACFQLIEKQLLMDYKIKFNEKAGFGEDLLFSIHTMIAAKTIKIANFDGYKIFYNADSITKKVDKDLMKKNIYELSIVYNEIYNSFSEEIENFRTNKFFEEINGQLLKTSLNFSIAYKEFCQLMSQIYQNLNHILFEKFDTNKQYKTINKIFIYCLLKRRIKLYYILMIIRKKLKGQKNG